MSGHYPRRVTVTLTEKTWQQLEAYRFVEGLSRSDAIRSLVHAGTGGAVVEDLMRLRTKASLRVVRDAPS